MKKTREENMSNQEYKIMFYIRQKIAIKVKLKKLKSFRIINEHG